MNIHLIWAQSRGGVIAKDGQMPWHLPEDLAHFKRCTLGQPVIMGRKTWDSLPTRFRPLPGRQNIVLTRDIQWGENFDKKQVLPAHSLTSALQICEHLGCQTAWVMGGGQLYAQAMARAHELWVTEIDAAFDGDTFAPPIDVQFAQLSREPHLAANGLAYTFVRYGRP